MNFYKNIKKIIFIFFWLFPCLLHGQTLNEKPSGIESFFFSYEKETYSQVGYNIFSSDLKEKPPLAGPDYIVGTGDKINIKVWGESLSQLVDNTLTDSSNTGSLDHNVVVNNAGVIILPEIGEINVNGKKLSFLESIISKKYKDFCKSCKTSVTIKNPRKIQILVSGNVKKPGYVIIPAGGSIYDVLIKAGGIIKKGTLRNIELKKKNHKIINIDLYNFINSGNIGNFPSVNLYDAIHVGTIGPAALLKGRITNPGIYELKKGELLENLVKTAGGMLPDCDLKHIEITSFNKNGRSIAIVSLEEKNISFKNGDTINFIKRNKNYTNSIFLLGAVKTEKQFEFKPGITLNEIINDINIFSRKASLEYGEIKRFHQKTFEKEILVFKPRDILEDSTADIELQPMDKIRIYEKVTSIKETMDIKITGEVKHEGTYPLLPSATLSTAIDQAGLLKKQAELKGIEIIRQKASEIQHNYNQIFVNELKKELTYAHKKANSMHFAEDEKIQAKNYINVLQDALALYDRNAPRGRIILDINDLDSLSALKDSKSDIILKPGDIIHVPKKTDIVTITGEVFAPASHIYLKNKNLSFYLSLSGGIKQGANYKNAFIKRINGSVISYAAKKAALKQVKLIPGDVVVIPPCLHRE